MPSVPLLPLAAAIVATSSVPPATWEPDSLPLVAAAMSLAVPGAGQLAAGEVELALLFGGVELAAVGALWAGTQNRSLPWWGVGAGLLVLNHAVAPALALLVPETPPAGAAGVADSEPAAP